MGSACVWQQVPHAEWLVPLGQRSHWFVPSHPLGAQCLLVQGAGIQVLNREASAGMGK